MKNYKIVLLAFLSTLIFSCEDAIDITQPGELYPDVAFQTVEDLNKGLNAVYGNVGGEDAIAFSSIFTDEIKIGIANGGQGLINDAEFSFKLNTNSGYAEGIWGENYAVINFATRVIEAAKNIVPAAGEEAQYKNIIAQAHILRAWGHFQLLTYFSANIKDDNALGVIAVDFIPLTTQKLPRNTNGEVFALINADLTKVSDLTTNVGNADRFYVSADFVKAFKARMALYREDYTTASALATELINSSAYPLTPRAQYGNIWKDLPVTQDEVIFKLDRIKGNSTIGSTWASLNSTIAGSPFYEVSTDLNDLLLPGDVRRSVIIDASSDGVIFPVGKYPGSGGLALLNDIKIFRTSEMFFIRAEAKANASDFAGVAADLQAVADKRFSTAPVVAVATSQQAAWAQILEARRIELAFEGHRYIDLRRVGPKAGVDIERNPLDCAINGACFLSSTDYRFIMPIPSAEIGANPAIATQQNPGYGSN